MYTYGSLGQLLIFSKQIVLHTTFRSFKKILVLILPTLHSHRLMPNDSLEVVTVLVVSVPRFGIQNTGKHSSRKSVIPKPIKNNV